MDKISDDRLNELREIAERATLGPWTIIGKGEFVDGPDITIGGEGWGVRDRDAKHIAAFDPTTGLALIDELEYYRWRDEHRANIEEALWIQKRLERD